MQIHRWLGVPLSLLMAGCSTWSPAEPLRIPAALLAACPESRRDIETNQDLAEAYLETRAALRECNGRLEALTKEYGIEGE